MATVMLAWQLGGGLGHAIPLLPFARGLLQRKHRVVVAFRDVALAAKVYRGMDVEYLQAPVTMSQRRIYPTSVGYVEMLANIGFGDDFELAGQARGWRTLFELVRPDLVMFDHSPIGLLAARGLPIRRVMTGLGFFCPPDVYPLPVILPDRMTAVDALKLRVVEESVLGRVNRLLSEWRQPSLPRLGALFSDVEETLLATFPELDHFGPRAGVRYWGPITAGGGKIPEWPANTGGKKIYAYLKSFPSLPLLLDHLKARHDSTLVFVDGISEDTRRKYSADNLKFETERLDIVKAAAECDLAILNANHGTLCDVMLAGKPSVQIPLFPEQFLLSATVRKLGVCEEISARSAAPEQIQKALDAALSKPSYAAAAAAFARRHAGFDQTRAQAEMLDRVCGVLGSSPPQHRTID